MPMTVADQTPMASPRRRAHQHRPGATDANAFRVGAKEKRMLIQKLPAAAAVLSLVGLAAPVGGAGADTTPTASAASAPALPISFVPPKVGPIDVAIGPTIIGGKVMDPGLNVSLPGISLPPITWMPPS
jgi:hypothetical protein